MRFIHLDPLGHPKGDGQLHQVWSAKRTMQTDGTRTLTIIAGDLLDKDDRILYRDNQGDWCEHIVDKPDTTRSDSQPVNTYECPSSLTEIAGKTLTDPTLTGGAQGLLTQALADTGWTVGTVQSNGVNTATLDLDRPNALEMLEEIANQFDLEIQPVITISDDGTRIASRAVNLLAALGDSVGREFTYGRDLTSVRRTIGSDHPITRLYVYGKTATGSDGEEGSQAGIESVNDGKPYIDAPDDVLLQWGRRGPDGTRLPYEGVVEFSDTDDPATLLRLGKAQLTRQSKPTVSYEADVTSLNKGGMNTDNVRLGDTVRITDPLAAGGLHLQGRVLKIEEDLLAGASGTSITLGTITDKLTTTSAKVNNSVQKLWQNKSAWDDAANLTGGYLDGVINGLNNRMNATGGYTYLIPGQGIFVYDKPLRADGSDRDASMVIQIGGGGFRIANSRKSDGTWAWRTMGTGAGLVADTIIAGMLRGGSSWWNLDTGEINFESGIIHNTANTVSINLDTGEVILKRGRITDGEGNTWDLTNGGGIQITDGTIRISGYVDGRWTTTTIDASGFHVTGSGGDAGTMTDYNGNVGLRGNTLGPDDNNYLTVGGDNAMKLVSGGSELFTIEGSASYSALFRASALGNSPFLEVGDDPQGSRGGTTLHAASGDSYPCIGISPSACYMLLGGNNYIVASDTGWATVYGIEVGCHGYEIYAKDGSIQMLTPSHNARIDLTNNYSALVYSGYHIMVDSNGVSQVTKAAAASTANANVMDTRLMALADDGLDLDSPDAYAQTPMGIEEIPLGKLHDVLRLLVDGDQEGAKALLDQYESEQRIWTQADYDQMNIPTPSASAALK